MKKKILGILILFLLIGAGWILYTKTTSVPSKKSNLPTVKKEEDILLCSEGDTLETRVKTPVGYKRPKAQKDSLEQFLRNYPMKKAGSPVLLYDGTKKKNQDIHAAVFQLPLEVLH